MVCLVLEYVLEEINSVAMSVNGLQKYNQRTTKYNHLLVSLAKYVDNLNIGNNAAESKLRRKISKVGT